MKAGLFKTIVNFWPPLFFSGIKVTYLAADYKEARVTLKLRWYNRNYVRTQYGGSLMSMTDPWYMLMIMSNLGRDYFVWDKHAEIDYIAPGKPMSTPILKLPMKLSQTSAQKTASGEKYVPEFLVDIKDNNDQLVARVKRRVYIKLKPRARSNEEPELTEPDELKTINGRNIITMLNVALCSYGMSGKVFHAPLITAEPRLKLHSVLQRSEPTALADYPPLNIVKSVDELIANPDIQLVVVNTPNEHHYPMTKAALLAGKHVVVEKPFTLSLDEGNELIALAQQKNLILSVFQNKRLESDYLDAQQIIQSGELGRIVEVEWHYDRYRTNVTHKKWKEDNLPGSGTWFDLGIHMVDSMLCLLGKPNAVYADMRSLRRAEGSTDYFNTIFYYDDMRVILRSSTYVSEKGATVAIHGDKGSFLKYGQDVQESQMIRGLIPGAPGWAQPGDDNYGVLHTHNNGEAKRRIIPGQRGYYEHYYQNVVDAITSKALLAFLPQQSLLGVEILLAAEESAKQQKLIQL